MWFRKRLTEQFLSFARHQLNTTSLYSLLSPFLFCDSILVVKSKQIVL